MYIRLYFELGIPKRPQSPREDRRSGTGIRPSRTRSLHVTSYSGVSRVFPFIWEFVDNLAPKQLTLTLTWPDISPRVSPLSNEGLRRWPT
ncbi:hypothetical protein DL98DRAFT_130242 [Cadophora sp. DSE1049]|nr:hypothetical protein DL98DRAFT_130242 [Cadophora sp. DSE1049]